MKHPEEINEENIQKPEEELYKEQGSELHRLKEMKPYDPEVFNRMYKVCRPVIRNHVAHIDCRRFNVTKDIIASYFWDKMLYVFNKYYGTCSEEHLKARILASLSTFKCKILRSAYGELAEYNQSLTKLDDLFDDSKELENDSEEEEAKEDMFSKLYDYMRENLSSDAYLVFEVLMTPPPYIMERIQENKSSRITNLLLVEFFNMPPTVASTKYISELRKDIEYWTQKAIEELHY